MSTSRSPLRQLKAEADQCAARLKAIASGEQVDGDPAGKIASALNRPSITFGVVMANHPYKAWCKAQREYLARFDDRPMKYGLFGEADKAQE